MECQWGVSGIALFFCSLGEQKQRVCKTPWNDSCGQGVTIHALQYIPELQWDREGIDMKMINCLRLSKIQTLILQMKSLFCHTLSP